MFSWSIRSQECYKDMRVGVHGCGIKNLYSTSMYPKQLRNIIPHPRINPSIRGCQSADGTTSNVLIRIRNPHPHPSDIGTQSDLPEALGRIQNFRNQLHLRRVSSLLRTLKVRCLSIKEEIL